MPQKSTRNPGAIRSGTVRPAAASSCTLVGLAGAPLTSSPRGGLLPVLQREPDLERHLPVADLRPLDVSTGLGHLEPAQVADGLGSLRDGPADRVLDAHGGRADQLDRLVDVLRHTAS